MILISERNGSAMLPSFELVEEMPYDQGKGQAAPLE
jgi:hypothetical protein